MAENFAGHGSLGWQLWSLRVCRSFWVFEFLWEVRFNSVLGRISMSVKRPWSWQFLKKKTYNWGDLLEFQRFSPLSSWHGAWKHVGWLVVEKKLLYVGIQAIESTLRILHLAASRKWTVTWGSILNTYETSKPPPWWQTSSNKAITTSTKPWLLIIVPLSLGSHFLSNHHKFW